MTRFCQDHIFIYTINILMMKISIIDEGDYLVVDSSIESYADDRVICPNSLLTDVSAQILMIENYCLTVVVDGFGIA
jgi:hypothetical protein